MRSSSAQTDGTNFLSV